jgi:hypothetical protein
MKRGSLLILSHQGFSFLEDVVAAAITLGLRPCILASAPASNERKAAVERLCGDVRWVERASLHWTDVLEAAVGFESGGHEFTGCVSIWEGYRTLMARMNQIWGATDLAPEAIRVVLDKFAMRNTLQKAGLSACTTEVVSAENLPTLRQTGRKFLKPRFGLASFGAFRLKNQNYSDLEKLLTEMASDREYEGVFGHNPCFIAEDYIEGIEASFEILAVDGKLNLLGVHEKTETEETGSSVLETSCVSPPLKITGAEISAGLNHLSRCFKILNLNTGMFHVEAKCHLGRWEVIEINPRLGGALIKESLRILNPGLCPLVLWIASLVSFGDKTTLTRLLSRIRPRSKDATFFRVYFGIPGRKIKSLKTSTGDPKPELLRISAQAGLSLPVSSREIFLGQALWKLDWENLPSKLVQLTEISKNLLEVEYEAV